MKKYFIILLSAAVLLVFSACANEASGQVVPMQKKTTVYERCYPLPASDKTLDLACTGNVILLLSQHEGIPYLALSKYNSSNIADALPIALEDGVTVMQISAGGNGFFYALTSMEESNGAYRVLQINSDGEICDSYDFELDEMPQAVYALPSGDLLLFTTQNIMVYSAEGEPLYSAQLPGPFVSAALTNSGPIIFAGVQVESGLLPCFVFDMTSRSFAALDIREPVDVIFTGQSSHGEFIFSDGRRLLEYDNGNAVELCIWNPSRYAQDALLSMLCLGEDDFLCAVEGENYLLRISTQAFSGNELEQVSTAVLLSEGSAKQGRELCEDIICQANINGEYQYVTTFYNAEQADVLLSELSTGKTPDLLIFFDGVNTATGVFDDLYTYLDTDPELNRNSFLPNLLEAASVEGRLYQLWDQVCVNTLVAPASLVGNKADLTCDDYDRLLDVNPEYSSVFPPYINRYGLLEWLAGLGVSTFVDKQNGSCDFTNEDFATLIQWCAAMPEEYSEGSELDYILEPRIISSPTSEYAGYENGVLKYEPMCFVGFPNGKDGYSYYCNSLGRGIAMAIPTASTCKQGAWDFIRWRLMFETQADLGAGACLPVNYAALEYICASSMSSQSAQMLKNLLERTASVENYNDEALKAIIRSSAEAYFHGDKPLTDTLEDIQSRAQIYLSEQFG